MMRRIFCGHHVEWLAWVLGAIVVVLAIVKAPAHEAPSGWKYPLECCSDRDCAELSEADIPKPLPGGDWLLSTGEIVPRSKVKWSPDGHYHLCRGVSGGMIFCLFVVPQGS